MGDGDTSSQCKWSSVPAGADHPFRTVAVRTDTRIKERRTPAETRAARAFAASRAAVHEHVTPVPLGPGAYAYTGVNRIRVIVVETDISDVHVVFRVSNAVIDVSGRTHARVTARHRELVLSLARTIAARLDRN